MGVKIELIGTKELNTRLKNISEELKTELQVALNESGMLLKEEIEESIDGHRSEPRSVDTGEFLSSITLGVLEDGVEVSSDVPQSIFMEFGTTKIPERRHFRNSMNRISPVVESKIKKVVSDKAK